MLVSAPGIFCTDDKNRPDPALKSKACTSPNDSRARPHVRNYMLYRLLHEAMIAGLNSLPETNRVWVPRAASMTCERSGDPCKYMGSGTRCLWLGTEVAASTDYYQLSSWKAANRQTLLLLVPKEAGGLGPWRPRHSRHSAEAWRRDVELRQDVSSHNLGLSPQHTSTTKGRQGAWNRSRRI